MASKSRGLQLTANKEAGISVLHRKSLEDPEPPDENAAWPTSGF